MSWVRQTFGLDTFDLFVHVGVTICLMGFVGVSHGPDELFPALTGASLLVLAIRRKIALRSGATAGLTTGEAAAERIAELEARVEYLEAGQGRVEELAERLDFTERLLTEATRQSARVGKGAE